MSPREVGKVPLGSVSISLSTLTGTSALVRTSIGLP